MRLSAGLPLHFGVEEVSLAGLDAQAARVSFTHGGVPQTLECDFIAGCDGFHGISRPSIPAGVLQAYERVYPYAWLGILAAAPPMGEIIYARHENGFALHSMRSATVTRLYLQCASDEPLEPWTDTRIWEEAAAAPDGARRPAPECGTDSAEIGDAHAQLRGRAHAVRQAVPGRRCRAHRAPTGAKGMNQAAADVQVLHRALVEFYGNGSPAALRDYSAVCLERVWKVQRFSRMMTELLHVNPADSPFDVRCREAELAYLATSAAGSATFAENYVGLPV